MHMPLALLNIRRRAGALLNYVLFIPSGSTGLITADSLAFKSRLDVTAEGWGVVETVVLVAPTPAAPDTPSISEGVVSGPAGFYRMTNGTTVSEAYIIPPFNVSDYGDPGDTVTPEYLTFSSEGPEILLPLTPQIEITAIGTLSRAGATVTLTPATWDAAGVTITRHKVINDVSSTLTGMTFDVFAGESYYVTETASKTGFITSAPAQTATGTRPAATPVYVGRKTVGFAGTSLAQNVTLTGLNGGIDTVPSAGDLVIVTYGIASAGGATPSITSSGYTSVASISSDSTYDTNQIVQYKIMGGTPDASIDFSGTSSTANAGIVAIQVWRGVDPSTPMDVTATTATGTTGQPLPPAITPTTAGAMIAIFGIAAGNTATTLTTGLSNSSAAIRTDTNSVAVAYGSFAWLSGTYTPTRFGGNSTSATYSWAAVTLALRPAP